MSKIIDFMIFTLKLDLNINSQPTGFHTVTKSFQRQEITLIVESCLLLLRAAHFDQDSPPTTKTRPLRLRLAPYGQDSPLASRGVEEEEEDACFFLYFLFDDT